MLTLEDSRDARGGNVLDTGDARQVFGHELVKVIIRSEATSSEDARSSRGHSQKEYLGEFGESERGLLEVQQPDANIHVDVDLIANLVWIGPRLDLNDPFAQQMYLTLPKLCVKVIPRPSVWYGIRRRTV